MAVALMATACLQGPDGGALPRLSGADGEVLAAADRAAASFRQGVRPETDPAIIARAERVFSAILDAARSGPAGDGTRALAWQLVVVASPETIVASFPNGSLFVHAGLLRTLPGDDALAAALGHAVARVLLRQGDEPASRRAAERALVQLGSFAPMPRSRGELEATRDATADYAGLVLAVEAGYDPDRAITAFDRLGLKARGDRVRERLPSLRARAAKAALTSP